MTERVPFYQLPPSGRELLARHAAWWRRQGMLYSAVPHAPLGSLWLPLAGGGEAHEDLDLAPEMLDLERLAGAPQESGPLAFVGDAIACRQPYPSVPWVEAILGCPVRATIQGGSMRTRSFIRSWAEWHQRGARRSQEWLDTLTALVEVMVARSGGRYAVAQTLMRGPSDLAEAILGPEMVCYALYDEPRELQAFLEEVTPAFSAILQAQLARFPRLEGGYVDPFGVWAPGTVVRTQCDASAFLSAEQYARYFMPYDVRLCEQVDYSTIHLHSGSLHTVDKLSAVERPTAIQVSLDPESSAPPLEKLLPVFRKILAVKPVIVDGPLTPQQVQRLMDQLPHDGLYIIARQGGW